MKLTILNDYDKIIEKKPTLIVNTNALILFASGGFAFFISSSLFSITLLSVLNLFYVIKKIMNNKENSNLNQKDIIFLKSLAYIYNTDYKKIKKYLNKNLLSKENISRAYKKRAKDLHPDMLTGDQKKFQDLIHHKSIVDNYLKEFKNKTK